MQTPTILVDSRFRARLLVWGTSAVVIGVGGLLALHSYLNTLVALSTAEPVLAAEKFYRLVLILAGSLFLLSSVMAGLGSAFAMRIYRTGQYPPPGMRVLWKTPLRTGRSARRIAYLCWGVATLVFLGGMGLSIIVWRTGQQSEQVRPAPQYVAVSAKDAHCKLDQARVGFLNT